MCHIPASTVQPAGSCHEADLWSFHREWAAPRPVLTARLVLLMTSTNGCARSPLFFWIWCILRIQISDACEHLPGLLLSIWANNGRLLTNVLSQIAVKEDHAAFIRVRNSLSSLPVRFWGWATSLVAKGFGTKALAEECRNEKQWENTFDCSILWKAPGFKVRCTFTCSGTFRHGGCCICTDDENSGVEEETSL